MSRLSLCSGHADVFGAGIDRHLFEAHLIPGAAGETPAVSRPTERPAPYDTFAVGGLKSEAKGQPVLRDCLSDHKR